MRRDSTDIPVEVCPYCSGLGMVKVCEKNITTATDCLDQYIEIYRLCSHCSGTGLYQDEAKLYYW